MYEHFSILWPHRGISRKILFTCIFKHTGIASCILTKFTIRVLVYPGVHSCSNNSNFSVNTEFHVLGYGRTIYMYSAAVPRYGRTTKFSTYPY